MATDANNVFVVQGREERDIRDSNTRYKHFSDSGKGGEVGKGWQYKP